MHHRGMSNSSDMNDFHVSTQNSLQTLILGLPLRSFRALTNTTVSSPADNVPRRMQLPSRVSLFDRDVDMPQLDQSEHTNKVNKIRWNHED